MMPKILLVEDEVSIQENLRGYLAREGFEVFGAGSGEEALAKMSEQINLVVLDWGLPSTNGLDVLKAIRKKNFSQPVIFLTAKTDLVDKVLGLEMGANDYVTKPFDPRELLARIRVQLRQYKSQSGVHQLSKGGIEMNLENRDVQFKKQNVSLTKTEFDLLRIFLENENKVFSRDELLDKVWNYDNPPTTRTVDTHVLQLRQKFKPEFFQTVHSVGYRFFPHEI
jgi:DNA-binding response OmpR family regulator